ncbi:hypothetical protein NKR23_g11730 [Pleurostoma richardsiae]|uniref:Uncharacterized protein n=1 Tax=Pleurostoma richardsiae TaxID=41990 RepID=A0AA38VGZ1_9PEZI|nr:hypothetical protein NKR23_g11730 [Pleurostoma richardsiae]
MELEHTSTPPTRLQASSPPSLAVTIPGLGTTAATTTTTTNTNTAADRATSSPLLPSLPTDDFGLPPPPPTPSPTAWECRACGRTWTVTASRCLYCGHRFCTQDRSAPRSDGLSRLLPPRAVDHITNIRRYHGGRRRRRGCRVEIDRDGLESWGRWRRHRARLLQGTAQASADVDMEEDGDERVVLMGEERQDCSLHCDWPSQCRDVRRMLARVGDGNENEDVDEDEDDGIITGGSSWGLEDDAPTEFGGDDELDQEVEMTDAELEEDFFLLRDPWDPASPRLDPAVRHHDEGGEERDDADEELPGEKGGEDEEQEGEESRPRRRGVGRAERWIMETATPPLPWLRSGRERRG